jgi:hypothetical protein
MKRILLTFITIIVSFTISRSQCTPVNCLSTLPAYGGVCDSVISDGRVNQPYSDFISFHVTTACVDAGLIDPSNSGIGIRVTQLHSFNFTGLPDGITAVTNQPSYIPDANGCASFTGIPTEVGVFEAEVSFLLDVNTWPLSVTCGGFLPPIPQNDNAVSSALAITILPDPAFTVIDTFLCLFQSPITLTPAGTLGGTFYGTGVTGNTFSPALAGLGFHTITYVVSAQEGTAIAPATDSSSITVWVDLCVGLGENTEKYFVSNPYPIPTNDILNIDFNARDKVAGAFRIIDIPGKTQILQTFEVQPGKSTESIIINNLAAGIYFIEISTGTTISVFRFLKN